MKSEQILIRYEQFLTWKMNNHWPYAVSIGQSPVFLSTQGDKQMSGNNQAVVTNFFELFGNLRANPAKLAPVQWEFWEAYAATD